MCRYPPSPLQTPLGFHAVPPVIPCPPSITPLLPPHGPSFPALLPLHLSSQLMVLPFLPCFHHASPPTSWSFLSCPVSITPLLPSHGPSLPALLPSHLSSHLMVFPFLPSFHHISPPTLWSFLSCPPSIMPLLPPRGPCFPALPPSPQRLPATAAATSRTHAAFHETQSPSSPALSCNYKEAAGSSPGWPHCHCPMRRCPSSLSPHGTLLHPSLCWLARGVGSLRSSGC